MAWGYCPVQPDSIPHDLRQMLYVTQHCITIEAESTEQDVKPCKEGPRPWRVSFPFLSAGQAFPPTSPSSAVGEPKDTGYTALTVYVRPPTVQETLLSGHLDNSLGAAFLVLANQKVKWPLRGMSPRKYELYR